MLSRDERRLGKDEYSKAIKFAEETGSQDLMHKIFLEVILSL